MSMTLEEAVELLCYGDWLNVISEHIGKQDTERIAEAMSIVGKALHPVSREQVEKVRGEWTTDGVCSRCGFDAMYYKGVPVQVRTNYCPTCGSPMTDKAVDMVTERLEALHGET